MYVAHPLYDKVSLHFFKADFNVVTVHFTLGSLSGQSS